MTASSGSRFLRACLKRSDGDTFSRRRPKKAALWPRNYWRPTVCGRREQSLNRIRQQLASYGGWIVITSDDASELALIDAGRRCEPMGLNTRARFDRCTSDVGGARIARDLLVVRLCSVRLKVGSVIALYPNPVSLPMPVSCWLKTSAPLVLARTERTDTQNGRVLAIRHESRAGRRNMGSVRFRSILCPVDFSPQSRTALRAAVEMARHFNASLTVMFVQDPLLVAAGKASYGGRRFVDRTRAELARFVNRAMPATPDRPQDIALLVSDGSPADEILRHAKRMRPDLLVMGSHGLSGIRKVFFGSTTEQVLRSATVPVLAIPPSIGSRRLAAFPTHVTRVIAPIDLAGEWQSDARRAATIAGELDAELLLVHILAAVQTPPWLRSAVRSSERRRIEKAKTALERVRTKLFSERDLMTTAVLVGEPAHEIARLTKKGRIPGRDVAAWHGGRMGHEAGRDCLSRAHACLDASTGLAASPYRWPFLVAGEEGHRRGSVSAGSG